MNADDIRSAIASNPQSQETRSYLIQQAVERDMADEIPDEWTVQLYSPDPDEYDDTQDLIADEYKFIDHMAGSYANNDPWFAEQAQSGIVISAHESGSLSIRVAPAIKPIAKFGIETADRLIDTIQAAQDWRNYHTEGSPPPHEVDPLTGISVQTTNIEGYDLFALSIPTDNMEEDYQFELNSTFDLWLNGLTSMANSAETYGNKEIEE